MEARGAGGGEPRGHRLRPTKNTHCLRHVLIFSGSRTEEVASLSSGIHARKFQISSSWHPLRQPHPRALDTLVARTQVSSTRAPSRRHDVRRLRRQRLAVRGPGRVPAHPRGRRHRGGGRRGWRCGECSTERRRRARANEPAPRRVPLRASSETGSRARTRRVDAGRVVRAKRLAPRASFKILAPTDSPSPRRILPPMPRSPRTPRSVVRVARSRSCPSP